MHFTAPIHALSLDIWGTLLKSDPQFKPARNEVIRATLTPHLTHAAFDAILRMADRQTDSTALGTGEDYGARTRIQNALNLLGLPPTSLTDEKMDHILTEQDRLARRHHPHAINPDDPHALREFANSGTIAVTSNTGMLPGALMRDLLCMAGFDAIDEFSFSDEVAADTDRTLGEGSKPWPAIFDSTFRALQKNPDTPVSVLRPQNVLHLGDNYVADYAGALAYGFQARHIEPLTPGGTTVADILVDLRH